MINFMIKEGKGYSMLKDLSEEEFYDWYNDVQSLGNLLKKSIYDYWSVRDNTYRLDV